MNTTTRRKHEPLERWSVCRPQARQYSILSVAWCMVSFPVIEILVAGSIDLFSWAGLLCGILIAPHPLMVGLAVYHAMTEESVRIRRCVADPNVDLRELL
jgi:hypothetical protein